MDGWESPPLSSHQINFKNSNLGRGVLKVGETTPPQKVQEKHFFALIFKICPPISQDTIQ